MKKLLFISVFLILLSSSESCLAVKWPLPRVELRSLDNAMRESGKYSKRNAIKLDSLKMRLSEKRLSGSARIETLIMMSRFCRQNMSDSSLRYSAMAVDASRIYGSLRERYLASLVYTDALAAAGFFSEAIHDYDSLANIHVDKDSRIEFFKVGRRLYSNLSNYVDDESNMAAYYEDRYVACDDSLVALMPENDNFRKFIIAERMVANGKFAAARNVLKKLMAELGPNSKIYGMTAFQLASVYKSDGDQTQYAAYLAKAAESDIVCNVREGFALPALAAWLYEQNEFAMAFRYINFALEEAYKGNARVRMVSMARWVPAIDEAYRCQISASRNEWLLFAAVSTTLFVALAVMTFFLFKQISKSRASQKALASTLRMKDAYIGNFIGLCSTYSEKYYSLLKLVDRKISSGQASELLKTIKSGKIGEGENEDFYKEIDSVVLTLYPDFVEKVNELLEPAERVRLKGGQLTPELRIYAFVRLGVSESTRIAKILNYSVNTVYAYRNRMRNRAIDREHFEENVLKIGIDDN